MVATAAVSTGMSLTDYLARSGERFELINGKEILMSPTQMGHDDLIFNLFLRLYNYVKANHLGDVWMERTFTALSSEDSTWVTGSLVPDVMVILGNRVTEYKVAHPNWRELPMALVPDLVIEVQSLIDRNPGVLRKVAYMLEVGVKVIWVINQSHQPVTVYSSEAVRRR
jgi:Uma2 family endonuclease